MQNDTSAAAVAEQIKALPPAAAARKIAALDGAEIAAAMTQLRAGFAQDVLAALPAESRARALEAAPPAIAHQWRENARYPTGTIGRLMEPVTAAFTGQRTLGETIESLRELVKTRFITYVWVVDDARRLLGIITMRDLLFNDRSKPLADVMLRDVFALQADTPLMDAMKLVLDRHYPVYPVVDAHRQLVGLVRGPMMFEAQAIEISLQAGSMVGLEKEERLATPWMASLRMRHPWLQLNLLTAFVAAGVVALFQGTIDRLVILALFLPVLAGQAGNTGCQALAVTLRGMTLGEVKRGTRSATLVSKEAWVGCLNGAGVGLVAAIGMYVVARQQQQSQPLILAAVVFAAMIGSCVASGVSGAMVPLVLKRLGFDPATASSIFLTTASDVLSMGLLLGLATMFVP